MASNYKKLGEFLRLTDERNSDLSITNLQGVSISKQFIPSIANIIGTDLSSYKIVRKGQFAYGPVTSRNGDKVSIALLESDDCIISSSYLSFEVVDKTKLDPEYLMLWFMRPEFDRYARFMSNGSAREIFDWECMCGVELPVPSIEEQRKIVHDYKVITDRIELLKKINENLEEQAFINTDLIINKKSEIKKIDELVSIYDSKRKPLSSEERAEKSKIYPYYGAASLMDYVDDYIFDGIYGLIGEDGTVITDEGFPIMQYVWGKFWVNNHAHIFQGKNDYSTELVYVLLKHTVIKDIVTGAVQLKINQENLKNLNVEVPCKDLLKELKFALDKIFKLIRNNTDEINKLIQIKELLLKNFYGKEVS